MHLNQHTRQNHPMMNSKTLFLALGLLLLLLSACATTSDEDFEDDGKTAAALYEEAKSALEQEDYETAIQRLETLEARFPFGKYAQQAQLDMAYAYFKFEEPQSATSAADRFIKLYPRHPYVDYAYYLKGLIQFNQGQSFFDKFAEENQAKRDPEAARKSFAYFSELVKRFPNSKYAKDSIERM
ncbi:MAG TPA: outer membrane protein assembly factor BamD, partial [Gammaproteobacteria bacterium]|nr:outer membrane protein assembly factor BamD [Gammaproteobacteria bacterium]